MTDTLGINAGTVVEKRYSLKNPDGSPRETWSDICRRVVDHVAQAEPDPEKKEEFRGEAFQLMLERKFIPNTPCLANAGTEHPMLAACFVVPVEDSITGIMDHAKTCAIIHRNGGGTGMSFEKLRPSGSQVGNGRGTASGPVSFMNIVNTVTDTIKQGGIRRGANMGILSIEHPDILRFIHAKNDQTSLTNYNISVTVTDDFMSALEADGWWQTSFNGVAWDKPCHDPLTGRDYEYQGQKPPKPGMLFAADVWRRMVESAWKYAEPGIIFIDEVNRHNHLSGTMGPIISCNPCGEQFLHANNACNLGSIDVSKFVNDFGHVDFTELRRAVHVAVRFLDNVIDTCSWPTQEIFDVVRRTRPVGLGIMGFADYLLKLKTKYGSQDSLRKIESLMETFGSEAWLASRNLGGEKGSFPEYEKNRKAYDEFFHSSHPWQGLSGGEIRNYEVTTIAPTGTISLVAECSSGIEPNFEWAHVRKDTLGERYYVHPLAAKALGIEVDMSDPESIKKAAEYVTEHKDNLPEYFVSAMELKAEDHVGMLAAFQPFIDNSISKTVNGAASDTVKDVDRVFREAHSKGVKCVSYYRDGSREGQVLTAIPKPTISTQAAPEPLHPKIERPSELNGTTFAVPINGTKLYVTVNELGGKIVEVFANGPISSSVGRLVSQMLRTTFTATDVCSILGKESGTHTVWFNGQCYTSSEQIVAACMREVQRRRNGNGSNLPKGSYTGNICSHCGGNVYRLNNCDTCSECGNSKCG